MEQKIQLQHPQRKKAVNISKEKYEQLKTETVKYLTGNPDGAFSDISEAIAQDFKEKKIKFKHLLITIILFLLAAKAHSQSICDSVYITPDTVYINQSTDTTVFIEFTYTGASDISYSSLNIVFSDTLNINITEYSITSGVDSAFSYIPFLPIIYNNPNIPANTIVNALFHVFHGGIPLPTIDCYLPVTFIINSTTGLNEPQNNLRFTLFPNPVQNTVSVSVFLKNSIFSITDLFGRKVYSTTLTDNQTTLDLGFLPDGIYIATIHKNEFSAAQKIIKIR